MIFDLTGIGIFVFILAILGYIAKHYYDSFYFFGVSHIPRQRGEFDRVLSHSMAGLLIVLFLGWLIIIYVGGTETTEVLDPLDKALTSLQDNQRITENEVNLIVKAFFGFFLFVFYGFFLIGGLITISLGAGLLIRYVAGIGFVIKLKDESQINGRAIYNETETLLYFIDLEGKWKAIKKENIESIEEKRQPSLFEIKIKSISKRDLILFIKSLGVSLIVMFFFYTASEGIDEFSVVLFSVGLVLAMVGKYLTKDSQE